MTDNKGRKKRGKKERKKKKRKKIEKKKIAYIVGNDNKHKQG